MTKRIVILGGGTGGTLCDNRTQRMAVVPPKPGKSLEVRLQAPGQPDKGQSVMQGPLQLAAAANPIRVAIDEHLEHHTRIVRRAADLMRVPRDLQGRQVQGVYKGVVSPYGIFRAHIVVETLRKQAALLTIGLSIGHPGLLSLPRHQHTHPPLTCNHPPTPL